MDSKTHATASAKAVARPGSSKRPDRAGPQLLLQLQSAVGNQQLHRLLARYASGAQRVAPAPPATCACGGTCPSCQANRIQPRMAAGRATPDAAPASVERVLRSPGRPLDSATLGFFEPRFGRSFDRIRLHTEPDAEESARSIGARAFAAGEHLVFNRGEYAPHTQQGRQLLAHELTHTLQQSEGRAPSLPLFSHTAGGLVIGHPDDPLEAEADRTADAVLSAPANRGTVAPARTAAGSAADGAVSVRAKFDPNAPVADFDVPNAEAASVKPAPPPAPAPAPAPDRDINLTFGGYTLGNSTEELTLFIDDLTMRYGREGPTRFLAWVERALPMRWSPDDPLGAFYLRLKTFVDAASERYRNIIADFKWQAYWLTQQILTDSATTVMNEQERYGLSELTPFGLPKQGPLSRAHLAELTQAAKLLFAKKEQLWTTWMAFEFPGGAHSLRGATQAEVDAYFATHDQYVALEGYLVALYPILGRFAEPQEWFYHSTWASMKPEDPLYKLAFGDAIQQFVRLRDEADERLEDIDKTRDGLDDDPDRVWTLPPVVESTKRAMNIQAGSLRDKLIQDELKQRSETSFWTKIALGVIQLAGALLAPFTAGLSLAVSVGIGAAQAYESWKTYQFEKAAAGTNFDRAKSLAASDPSMTGVALDIVGVVFDVAGMGAELRSVAAAQRLAAETALLGRAEQAFREISPLVHEAQAAKAAGKATADTEKAIETAAARIDPTGALGNGLVAEIHSGEAGAEALEKATGIAKGELKPLVEARSARSAEEARLLKESGGLEQHLSADQINAEKEAVRRGTPQPSTEPGYLDEVDIGNGHKWRRAPDGTWCRFTIRTLCGTYIPGVPAAQVEAELAGVEAAKSAGVPDLIYGDGRVMTRADFPDILPDSPVTIGRPSPQSLPTAGREVSLSDVQNIEVQQDIEIARGAGATNLRVNQTQVIEDLRAGTNRPDLYFELNGRRIHIEYDRFPMTRAIAHARRILSNDPEAIVILKGIDY